MKIAVASGKGGTGKTMVATSLAEALVSFYSVNLLDCDVEAPNAHLFLKPYLTTHEPAIVLIPEINADLCIACGACVAICQYHALAMIAEQILVFSQLCHGCGSCMQNCPMKAILEIPKEIGLLHHGNTVMGISHFMGALTASEPMPTPIIHQLKRLEHDPAEVTIFDSPPGASCAVVATLYDADYVLLVTESTPFGLHDLKQMLRIVSRMGILAGVILNRQGIGDGCVETFLIQTPYPILMKIPYQSKIAMGLAAGELLINIFPDYRSKFIDLFTRIEAQVKNNKGVPC